MRKTALLLSLSFMCMGCAQIKVDNNEKEKNMNYTSFTEKEILYELDNSGHDKFFMDLEHPYVYTIGSRINLYANDTNWAIAFEKYGYHNRGYEVQIELNYFGNCIINCNDPITEKAFNTKWISLIPKSEFAKIESRVGVLNNTVDQDIQIRNKRVNVEKNISIYEKMKIFKDQEIIRSRDFSRLLFEIDPNLFHATDQELKQCIPESVPKILTIDDFHYKYFDFYSQPSKGNKPSSYETFQLIAKILVSKDPSLWKPNLKSNNNWRNYPKAGDL